MCTFVLSYFPRIGSETKYVLSLRLVLSEKDKNTQKPNNSRAGKFYLRPKSACVLGGEGGGTSRRPYVSNSRQMPPGNKIMR